jgi:diketogulonate reductase-like aldo/keto reductase
VVTIPKAATEAHVRENAAVGAITLTAEDLRALDHAFAAPRCKQALSML